MLKAICYLFVLFFAVRLSASPTRSIDADSITSSDKTATYTLPTGTDTIVGRTSTDTLSNKVISGTANTLSNLPIAGQFVSDTFSGAGVINGTATAFTLSFAPPATAGVIATLNGLVLTYGSGNDFTISGTTLTMTSAPALGQSLKVTYSRY